MGWPPSPSSSHPEEPFSAGSMWRSATLPDPNSEHPTSPPPSMEGDEEVALVLLGSDPHGLNGPAGTTSLQC